MEHATDFKAINCEKLIVYLDKKLKKKYKDYSFDLDCIKYHLLDKQLNIYLPVNFKKKQPYFNIFLKNKINEFLAQKNLFLQNLEIIQKEQENEIKLESLIKINLELYKIYGVSKEEWKEKTTLAKDSRQEKLLILKNLFHGFIFNQQFLEVFNKSFPPVINQCSGYLEEIHRLHKKAKKIENLVFDSVNNFFSTLRSYVNLEGIPYDSQMSIAFFYMQLQVVYSSYRQRYHIHLCIQALADNFLEQHHFFSEKLKQLQPKFKIYQKNIGKIFFDFCAKLTCDEQELLIGYAIQTSEKLSIKNALINFKNLYNDLTQGIQSNIRYFSEFGPVFNKTATVLDAMISSVHQDFPFSLQESLRKDKDEKLVQNEDVSNKDSAANFNLFEALLDPSWSTDTVSTTISCKNEAKQIIFKQEQRQKKHTLRHENDLKESIQKIEKSVADTAILILYCLTNSGAINIVPVSSIKNTKYLYACWTSNFLAEKDLALFKEIGLQGKKLARDDLGHSGIKIYGFYGLFVKSTHTTDRLACAPYPILTNSDDISDYVYMPHSIISHVNYQKIINNPSLLENYFSKKQQFIAISFDQQVIEEQKILFFEKNNSSFKLI